MVIPNGFLNLHFILGRKADAVMAAHLASEAALRLVKPGNQNLEVTDSTLKISEAYECRVCYNLLDKLYY